MSDILNKKIKMPSPSEELPDHNPTLATAKSKQNISRRPLKPPIPI